MAAQFRRGFKSESESMAAAWRKTFRLRVDAPLDPRKIARHLGIEVLTIADLSADGLPTASAARLLGPGLEDFSAVTVCFETKYVIVENEAHSEGRRSNSVAHEVAHVLLKHQPHPFANAIGRHYHDGIEHEADWLGGTLLVPRPAALTIVKARLALEDAAAKYGVSVALMRQRINMTGVLRQVGAP